MSFEKPDAWQPETAKYQAPRTPHEARQAIADLLGKAGLHETIEDFFSVCAPCGNYEKYTAGRFEYHARLLHCASEWRNMTPADRSILWAGADGGVHWRGEPVIAYQRIWHEHQKMREMGCKAYLAENSPKLPRKGSTL